MNKNYIVLSVFIIGLLFVNQLQARGAYLNTWRTDYLPQMAESADVACQLCHQRSTGGNGWNEYGWAIREQLGGVFTSSVAARLAAFRAVESQNMNPADVQSATFLQEVQQGAQPGWREGNVNVIRFRTNDPNVTQEPPTTFPCGTLIDSTSSLDLFCDSVGDPVASDIAQGNIGIDLQTIATGFFAPLLVVSEPSSPDFVYVIEQRGTVQKVNIESGEKTVFLDFSAEVTSQFGSAANGRDERGLIGFAFHPNYASNNLVYTFISKDIDGSADFSTLGVGESADHQSVVSQWFVNDSKGAAIATLESELIVIDQPQANNNSGNLVFGPDGNLFISVGDGGGRNDLGVGHGTFGNARDNTNPLGTILRIDPAGSNSSNGLYGIPADNPFVGSAGLDEIFVFGFRNPFRFSIETLPNDEFNLYVGDVGQDTIQEVNVIPSTSLGGNYGWNFKEGSLFFVVNPDTSSFLSNDPPPDTVIPTLIDPVAEYDRDEGVSVIGGHVYTGGSISSLNGHYVFGEFSRSFPNPDGRLFYLNGANEIREFNYVNRPDVFLTGFGVDTQNELYIVGSDSTAINSPIGDAEGNGVLRKLIPAEAQDSVEQNDEFCFPIIPQNGGTALICL